MRTIVLVISLFCVTAIFANNNNEKQSKKISIKGQVLDNTESLTGVKVILDNKETTVYTDFEGNFTIDNVLAGEHTLSFSLITYDGKNKKDRYVFVSFTYRTKNDIRSIRPFSARYMHKKEVNNYKRYEDKK